MDKAKTDTEATKYKDYGEEILRQMGCEYYSAGEKADFQNGLNSSCDESTLPYLKKHSDCIKMPYYLGVAARVFFDNSEDSSKSDTDAMATAFLKKYEKYIMPAKRRKSRAQKNNKWRGDMAMLESYRKTWENITKDLDEFDLPNKDVYFETLIERVKDVQKQTQRHRKSRNLLECLVLLLPILSTIFGTYAVMNGVIPDAVTTIFSIAVPITTAAETFVVGYKKFFREEETWLRHSLNYAKLTKEMEEFFSCGGKYADVCENDKGKKTETIKNFQIGINNIIWEDYKNFFSNMGCVNYDPESSGK